MNRERVAAELPDLAPAVLAWLDDHPATWEALARDVVVDIGAALLQNGGEAGVTPKLYALLRDHPSPAVQALARSASFASGKLWRVEPTLYAIERYLDLPPSWHKANYARLRRVVFSPRR